MAFPRGSEWRRWDLHIHAPGTALEDQFGDWDEFLAAVESADSSIAVVGVTDYASINTYKEFKTFYDAGRMQNIALAIPNIEFRISPPTKSLKGINLHLLVCPDEHDHIQRIEEALGRLSIQRHDENIPCSRAGLTRLGKLTQPSLAGNDDAAYREGVNQFKIDFEVFREWLTKEKWMSRNSLVAIAAGSGDGASGLVDGGYQSTRREFYTFSSLVLSGNPSEREAWLGRGSIPQDEFRQIGGPKPVIHGSDAHAIVKLFAPDQQRYCWIKSDPTFDGLRQTLYEPEDRVWIGRTSPLESDTRSAIESVTVTNSSGWLEDQRTIPLNPGLVAVIGLKGSGKTAFADLIASAAGAQLDADNSFVSRAAEHIDGLQCDLIWNDGAVESSTMPDQPVTLSRPSIRYLSQKFVDTLCSGDSLGEDLQQEIESVIFEHLGPEKQLDAESFAEVRRLRTEGIQESRTAVASQIQQESDAVAVLDERRAAILKRSPRRLAIPNELAKIVKATPKIGDSAGAKRVEELQKLQEKQAAATRQVALLQQQRQRVDDAERQIALKVSDTTKFWGTVGPALKQLGFSAEDIESLAPQWDKQPEVFQRRRAALDKEIAALLGKKGEAENEVTASGIERKLKRLEDELKLDKANKVKLLALDKQRRTLSEEKRKLNAEFEWAQKTYKTERQATQGRRMDSYVVYFELMKEECDVLEELYTPLKDSLKRQGMQEQKIDVTCRVEVDTAAWLAKGAELFDLRKTGSFRFDQVEALATSTLTKAWMSCDDNTIRTALDECLNLIKEADVLRTQLKSGFAPRDVAEWLFSVDHISITHAIKYEGKDLRLLSPGTKGIVLLILYLGIDRFDTRPLIVDQPDENLDNLSTYEILRSYFREAKKRRQIIIITHNPNLVVNTDAEQVIVADGELRPNGLPTIRYSYGSLEANEMDGPIAGPTRATVCRIMEGGTDAFKMRENRYGRILR